MKWSTFIRNFLVLRERRRNLLILLRVILVFAAVTVAFAAIFHWLMLLEGRSHSWFTGVYWTLVVMSTLGLGDITFQSDLGRLFSVVVLLTGSFFLLIILPFVFIQLFYRPWREALSAARAPRALPAEMSGHVLFTQLGPVEHALVRMLARSAIEYAVIVPDLTEALSLNDRGYRVVCGDVDDPETYRNAGAERAALVFSSQADTTNSNVAFTVRETSATVPIITTASTLTAVDILELAGSTHVLHLGDMLGRALARRVFGRTSKSHVIGHFGPLLIAEAAAPAQLIGKSLKDIRLREQANVSVVGIWQRGRFQISMPQSAIQKTSILILAGSREQLDDYDRSFGADEPASSRVVILGGGRVGRATARGLATRSIDYRIVEKFPERARDPERVIAGDAAELSVLRKAGIDDASSVVITTHDDDMNVYLTLYCRRLRPDIQILGRVNTERNISTLYRAGADFVMSYASTGASSIFNLLRRSKILLLAEGLDVFKVKMPAVLAGVALKDSGIRERTGCNVVAVEVDGVLVANPDPMVPLAADTELVVIGDAEAEDRFMTILGGGKR